MLTLISYDLCPYVQRAAIALAEKGVPFERRTVDLANRPEWFKSLSPLGKVPLLQVVERAHMIVGRAPSASRRTSISSTVRRRLVMSRSRDWTSNSFSTSALQ